LTYKRLILIFTKMKLITDLKP